jgi:poly-gamma-glutamate capsule biosynthesis protein CapA/YwtB (metallophosphatase superfamily)
MAAKFWRILSAAKIAALLAGTALSGALVGTAMAQDKPRAMTIVLTGQTLLQADPRALTPEATEQIASMLSGDVVFTNFETTIREAGDDLANLTPYPGSGGHFAPPGSLRALQSMGVNLLSLANNHAFDFGELGVRNTVERTTAMGLASSGVGMNLAQAAAPAYLKTGKGTIALVSAASGLLHDRAAATATTAGVNAIHLEGGVLDQDAGRPSEVDRQRVLSSIRDARKKANIVISYLHNHAYDRFFPKMMSERLPERFYPPKWIKQWAREQVDAGADIVVLHGAPILQGVEIYRGKPIFYDLGNFIFQLSTRAKNIFEQEVWSSAVAKVEMSAEGSLRAITFEPIVLNELGRGEGAEANATRGLPRPSSDEQAREILSRIVTRSEPFGTKFIISGRRAVLDLRK